MADAVTVKAETVVELLAAALPHLDEAACSDEVRDLVRTFGAAIDGGPPFVPNVG